MKRGRRVERNSSIKRAQAWVGQGWVTSWEEGHQSGEELQGEGWPCMGSPRMGDLLNG